MVLGQFLRLCEPQFPPLYNGNNQGLSPGVNVGWNKTQEALRSATGTEEVPSKHLPLCVRFHRGL